MRISPVSFNNAYSRSNNIRNNTQLNNNNNNCGDTFTKSSKANVQAKNNKNISFGFFDSELADKIVRQVLTSSVDTFQQSRYNYAYQRLKDSEYVRILTGPDKSLMVEYDDVCLVDPFARNYCEYTHLARDPRVLEALADDTDNIKRVLTEPIKIPKVDLSGPRAGEYSDRIMETIEALAK